MDKDIQNIYEYKKIEIQKRISEFKNIWTSKKNSQLFIELVFCLLTPQARARNAWSAVEQMIRTGDLYTAEKELLSTYLNSVRFKNNKAKYIVEARKKLFKNGVLILKEKIVSLKSIKEKREWLVININGYGFKEASHFLRNIGFVENIAILDRHILKNLKLLNIIDEIPSSLSKKTYYEIEEKMLDYSSIIKIPAEHLDLLFWYKENGEIFK